VWVDDPRFNAGYHVRHTALPGAAGQAELRALAGRVFSQELDRTKPLWEIWLVERVGDDAFALVCKTHHALVDGISGVDIMTVLLDLEPGPPPPPASALVTASLPGPPWHPGPEPTPAALLADALAERTAAPLDAARAAASALADPRGAAARAGRALHGLAAMAVDGVRGAPPSPLNVRIGPHRRYAWTETELARLKRAKDELGGTVNDAVLTVVAGALRALLLRRGRDPDGSELKALVPVSVRAQAERGALGNRVSAFAAPLPVGEPDPVRRFHAVHAAVGDLKASGRAVGAETILRLAGFAAPTVLSQAARLQSHRRLFNLTVTNVPGPQFPLYLLGRRLRAFYPKVPLALNTALGIAVMSYDGRVFFGLLGDYDAMPDLDLVAADVEAAVAELAPESPGAGARARPRRAAARS
jgi:WS/DGAT/MGAT family acyltransferase